MEQVYLFLEDSTKVTQDKFMMRDVATIYCPNSTLQNKIRTLPVYHFKKGEKRIIFTALKLFELITSSFPDVSIIPLGSTDIIVEKDENNSQSHSAIYNIFFLCTICLITFFGSLFTIMAFNNDVAVHALFSQFYEFISGKKEDGFTLLELGYSIGLGIGILVFYNHFGRKKLSPDPTPLEIEMRLYENDIHTTLIDGVKRNNQHIDVS